MRIVKKQLVGRPVAFLVLFVLIVLAISAVAVASDVDVKAVADTAPPSHKVTLERGGEEPITIHVEVTGRQSDQAKFYIYSTWTYSTASGWVGSDLQDRTVAAQANTKTDFYITGKVAVGNGVADGKLPDLVIAVDHVWNTDGATQPLIAGSAANYEVTVAGPATPSDTTAPVTTVALSPDNPDGNNGWYVSAVNVSLFPTDSGTGVDKTYYRVDGAVGDSFTEYSGPVTVSTDGQHTFYFYSVDKATPPNTEEIKTVSFKIDRTKPTINIAAPVAGAIYLEGQTADGIFWANDATSGISGTSPTSSPSALDMSVGSHTFSVTATDNAGNSENQSVGYTVYGFSGVLQPINNDGSSSIFKLGRGTIPVKFQVWADAGHTIPITDLQIYIKFCWKSSSLGTYNELEDADSTSSATSGNLFRYDPTGKQYVFNWATKGLEAGVYQIQIRLGTAGAFMPLAEIGLQK